MMNEITIKKMKPATTGRRNGSCMSRFDRTDLSAFAEPDNVELDGMTITPAFAAPDNVESNGRAPSFPESDNVESIVMTPAFAVPAYIKYQIKADEVCPNTSGMVVSFRFNNLKVEQKLTI